MPRPRTLVPLLFATLCTIGGHEVSGVAAQGPPPADPVVAKKVVHTWSPKIRDQCVSTYAVGAQPEGPGCVKGVWMLGATNETAAFSGGSRVDVAPGDPIWQFAFRKKPDSTFAIDWVVDKVNFPEFLDRYSYLGFVDSWDRNGQVPAPDLGKDVYIDLRMALNDAQQLELPPPIGLAKDGVRILAVALWGQRVNKNTGVLTPIAHYIEVVLWRTENFDLEGPFDREWNSGLSQGVYYYAPMLSTMDGALLPPLTNRPRQVRIPISRLFRSYHWPDPPASWPGIKLAGVSIGTEIWGAGRVATTFDNYETYTLEHDFTGGAQVASGDVDGDGKADILVGAGPGGQPRVRVYSGRDGSILRDFLAYKEGFLSGVHVAAADLDGDGKADIITGPGDPGSPQVRAYSGADGSRIRDFLADQVNLPGGEHVAAADFNGDGKADIITGSGPGGPPRVQVFNGRDGSRLRDFLTDRQPFGFGVPVAAGDVDGDGQADIITGTGPGGPPQVRVFSGRDGSLIRIFLAFPGEFLGGVRVASGDFDGDGKADIVVGAGPGWIPLVRVFRGADGSRLKDGMAFHELFTGGVFVGAQDTNGDGRADLIVGPGEMGGPTLKVINGSKDAILSTATLFTPPP